MDINLTASQVFTNNQAGDNLFFNNPVNLGSNNLTLSTKNAQMFIAGTITGSGTLTFSSPPGGSQSATYKLESADTSFSGPVVINSGAIVQDASNTFNALGTGAITVNNGGALDIISSSSTGTLTNNLNLAGSGLSSQGIYAITSCLANSGSCTSANTALTLSGKVTLAANTVLVNGAYTVGEGSPPTHTATLSFSGSGLYNGFTLTGLANSSTIVNPPTPIVTAGGSSSSNTSSSSVKAPNTGDSLVSAHKYFPLIGGALLASSVIFSSIALRNRFSKVRVRK